MTESGILKRVGTEKQVTATFKNRTFDIETIAEKYPQTLRFELSQDSCDIIDAYGIGEEIEVTFNLRGKSWQKTPEDDVLVFHTLAAWKIQRPGTSQGQGTAQEYAPPSTNSGPREFPQANQTNSFADSPKEEEHNDLPF
jgi:hypothetical protein